MEENKNEEIKEEKEEVVNEQSQMENNNAEENKKCKSNKPFVIIIVVLAMALTFGCGIMLGKKLFETKNTNKGTKKENEVVDNNQTESTNTEKNEIVDNNNEKDNNNISVSFEEITKNLISGTTDNNIVLKYEKDNAPFRPYGVWIQDLSINGKSVTKNLGMIYEITNIYKVQGNYLIVIKRAQDVRSTYYYLYDSNGNLLQEIYELDDNMVISTDSATFKDNIIELDGTRLTHGPSLVKDGDYYICDKNEISKANLNDDYPVMAKYQLIYSNNKFEIKMVGVIETLSSVIEKYCNE